MLKVIKYKNRKYYNLENSKYINLSELSRQVNSGSNVEVIEYNTNKDITKEVLIEALKKGLRLDRFSELYQ